ncbi:MAG: ATP-binding protein [Actinobacteria bacterium]|nr:ATP-binding protein [Actinomycetota bacterium]
MGNSGRLLKVSRYTLEPATCGLAVVREFLKVTLTPFPLAQPHVHDVLSATHEACKNAIEHNPGVEHPVEVTCKMFADAVVVEVSDKGAGFDPGVLPPPPPDPMAPAGRGLFLICSLLDNVDIDTGRNGTRVTMSKRF